MLKLRTARVLARVPIHRRPQVSLRFNSSTPTQTAEAEIERPNQPLQAQPEQADELDEEKLAAIRRLLKARSIDAANDKVELSPELELKLNSEFDKFLREFLVDFDFTEEFMAAVDVDETKFSSVHTVLGKAKKTNDESSGNVKGHVRFPNVLRSDPDAPYTSQELYLRRLFHASTVSGMGSVISEVYQPHKDVFHPPSIRETSIATLLAAGAHLGHSTALLRQNNQPFLYGVRDGIHIIDLDSTIVYLRRAAKVVEGVAKNGGVILYVGTMEGQERSLQVAAERSNGYYVHTRWIPGTLTNSSQISASWERVEVDMEDKETGRKLAPGLLATVVKPDLVVVLNPVENRNLLNECIAARVPTIGIVDTNSEPTLVTYPIPANDDSVRATDLIVGILSKSAHRGRKVRVSEFKQYKIEASKEADSAAFNDYGDRAEPAVSEQELAVATRGQRRSGKRGPKAGLAA